MPYDPRRHRRRSIRLRGYDYTQAGAYCVTICARDRASIFGDIVDGVVRLSPVGAIVQSCWVSIPDHFPAADLDAFVVMPNHLHGIVVLGSEGTACRAPTKGRDPSRPDLELAFSGERFGAPVAGSIPTIVRSFKAAVTRAINEDRGRGTACRAFLAERIGPLPSGRIPSLWQANYYEHVIRDDRSLESLQAYIAANPARWAEDSLHPDHADQSHHGRSRNHPPP